MGKEEDVIMINPHHRVIMNSNTWSFDEEDVEETEKEKEIIKANEKDGNDDHDDDIVTYLSKLKLSNNKNLKSTKNYNNKSFISTNTSSSTTTSMTNSMSTSLSSSYLSYSFSSSVSSSLSNYDNQNDHVDIDIEAKD